MSHPRMIASASSSSSIPRQQKKKKKGQEREEEVPKKQRREMFMRKVPLKEEQQQQQQEQQNQYEYDEVPTLEEMRAQLGPVGRTVAGAVEVGIVTAGSYLSGGILGYFLGGIMGVPTLFRPSDLTNNNNKPPSSPSSSSSSGVAGGNMMNQPPSRLPPGNNKFVNFSTEAGRRMKKWNSKAFGTCKTWGELSAAFSGFHALTRVVRGGKEDKWNGILGAAAAGAYLNRKGGPQSMAQGAATYAGFTYMIDTFLGSDGMITKNGRQQGVDDEFDFTDRPVIDDDAEEADRGF